MSNRRPTVEEYERAAAARMTALLAEIDIARTMHKWKAVGVLADALRDLDVAADSTPPPSWVTDQTLRHPRTVVLIEDVEPETLAEQGIQ